MANKKYYITTTIPYVNAEPHIGFALEIIQADCLARYHRILGEKVFHNFGTDEHGLKVYQKAQEAKKDPQEYVDEYAKKYKGLKKALNLEYDAFIRTTDPNHVKAAQAFWKLCDKKGDIYKKSYKTKYCVGCELEKTDSELIDGFCEFHPGKPLEIIEEENYFFRFSKYQKPLLDLYKNNPKFVVPSHRLKEIKTFVQSGLKDFSISRLKKKLPWGIPIPGDPEHVMYVWFDALINYISTLGWPDENKLYKDYWPGVQTAGKDNLRQQSAIWQAMLLSADLPTTKQIFIHGFINSGGERMSKSLGNVIDPFEYAKDYGTDALRYYLLAKIHPWDDSDFTKEKFEKEYQADLANGLGNLVSRVAKLAEKNKFDITKFKPIIKKERLLDKVGFFLKKYDFLLAAGLIWNSIGTLDKWLSDERPWLLNASEANRKLGEIIVGSEAIDSLLEIAEALKPFLPETAEIIENQFKGPKIKSAPPLFPRLP